MREIGLFDNMFQLMDNLFQLMDKSFRCKYCANGKYSPSSPLTLIVQAISRTSADATHCQYLDVILYLKAVKSFSQRFSNSEYTLTYISIYISLFFSLSHIYMFVCECICKYGYLHVYLYNVFFFKFRSPSSKVQ